MAPWTVLWDRNYFAESLPWLAHWMTNGFVKGGVTGVGVVTTIAGLRELANSFLGQSTPQAGHSGTPGP